MNKFYISLLSLIYTLTINAQVEIPDAYFLNFLKTEYPHVIDANDHLLPSVAATITSEISCVNQNIQSLDGIQYFTSITYLNCGENQLSSLNQVAQLHQLKIFYCYKNSLSSLPQLSNFPQLTELSCEENKIASLSGLEALTQLQYLRVNDNELTSIEGLEHLTSCTHLYLTNNRLTNLPDWSNLTNPIQINISHNQLETIGAMSQMTNLTYFIANANYFSNITLEHIYSHPNRNSQFIFDEQKKTYTYTSKQLAPLGGELQLTCPSHFTSPNNQYQWYINDKIIVNATSSTLIITSITKDFAGTYKCLINNTTPFLSTTTFEIIYSDVEVVCQIQVEENAITKEFTDCNSGWSFSVNPEYIQSTTPLTFAIYSSIQEVSPTADDYYSRLFENKYNLHITDENNCVLDTILTKPTVPECTEDLIFSPNNDGLYDEYFIEEEGQAKIFNRYGLLIKTLQTPAYWDGTNNQNQLVPDGYYVIIINDQKQQRIALKK